MKGLNQLKNMADVISSFEKHHISKELLHYVFFEADEEALNLLRDTANKKRRIYFSNHVYIRGLIELTNYCKNDCLYCGIRKSNSAVVRYRLNEDQVFAACVKGYDIGFRTFVLQGGEDPYFTDEVLCSMISKIKNRFPDCALTLSLGERSFESYHKLYKAGADRYLLRHETADEKHYQMLHPGQMSFKNRMKSLSTLKEIGFQTGAGFMVGSPYQKLSNLVSDLQFIAQFQPAMVGIGPFLPASNTPFSQMPKGCYQQTLKLLALVRIINPRLLIPSTTALGTATEDGRIAGINWGANVLMPNLTPEDFRRHYNLYDNKEVTGLNTKKDFDKLNSWLKSWGFEAVISRGDFPNHQTPI